MSQLISEQQLGRIKPDMDVCDIAGDKVGTISHVFRHGAPPGQVATDAPGEEILEVKTGFLGLGTHLYIPLSAVQEVLQDCVFLSKPREAFDDLGWREQPAHLAQLH